MAISIYKLDILKSKARKISLEVSVAVIVFVVCFSTALIMISRDSNSLLYYGDAVSHLVIPRLVFDSVTPGLANFGTVWLPITHIMLLPFVTNDFLFHTGLAGTLVSALSTSITALLLFRITKLEFGSTPAAVLASALYVTNTSVIYMGIIPMMEAPFMMFFMLFVYFMQQWYHAHKNNDRIWNQYRIILKCALSVTAATLTRYEGWVLPIAVGIIILVIVLLSSRGHLLLRPRVEALLSVSIVFSFLGIILWIIWNAVIFGNPLSFANGPYSAQVQASTRPYMQYTHHNPINSLAILSDVAENMYGIPVIAISVIGLICYLIINKRWNFTFRLLLLGMLTTPILSLFLAMVQGSGEMWHAPLGGWFNGRYLIFVAPLFAFGSVSLAMFIFNRRKSALTFLTIVIIIGAYGSAIIIKPLELGKTTALADSAVMDVLQPASGPDRALAKELGRLYNNGYIVVFTPAYGIMISAHSSGLQLKNFIFISGNTYWNISASQPWVYGAYLVIEKKEYTDYLQNNYAANLADPVYEVLEYWQDNRDILLQHYNVVYENKGYEIMKRKY